MKTINFTVLEPSEALSKDVECLRIAEHIGDLPLEVKVCPNGYPGIVFQHAADSTPAIENIAIRSANTSNILMLFLHGQGAEPSVMLFRGTPYTTIQMVLKPHALYSLFGWDASLHHQGLSSSSQFGAFELEKQLLVFMISLRVNERDQDCFLQDA